MPGPCRAGHWTRRANSKRSTGLLRGRRATTCATLTKRRRRSFPPRRGLREGGEVERLAYTRRQAADALGVSISTIDRRVVPSIDTVKLPWGQRLIPVDELERLPRNHLAPARRRPVRRAPGRPAMLPRDVVERIRLEYARGRALAEIARTLTAEGVPTAHGGRRWWPSTVRAVLVRSSRAESR